MDGEKDYLTINKLNITLINTNSLLKTADLKALGDLMGHYHAVKDSNTSLWRKLFYNYYITFLSQCILQTNNKVILYYQDIGIAEYKKLLNKLCKYLPFPLIVNGIAFDEISSQLKDKKAAILSKIEIAATKDKPLGKYNLHNFRVFLKTHGLTFLHSNYFNQIKNKMILAH